jgi:hypothetical protein
MGVSIQIECPWINRYLAYRRGPVLNSKVRTLQLSGMRPLYSIVTAESLSENLQGLRSLRPV